MLCVLTEIDKGEFYPKKKKNKKQKNKISAFHSSVIKDSIIRDAMPITRLLLANT